MLAGVWSENEICSIWRRKRNMKLRLSETLRPAGRCWFYNTWLVAWMNSHSNRQRMWAEFTILICYRKWCHQWRYFNQQTDTEPGESQRSNWERGSLVFCTKITSKSHNSDQVHLLVFTWFHWLEVLSHMTVQYTSISTGDGVCTLNSTNVNKAAKSPKMC